MPRIMHNDCLSCNYVVTSVIFHVFFGTLKQVEIVNIALGSLHPRYLLSHLPSLQGWFFSNGNLPVTYL